MNAFFLAFMIVITAYYKKLYQTSAIQMRKNFGVAANNRLSVLFFNIVKFDITKITCFIIPSPYYEGQFWNSTNYETGITYQVKLNEAICAMTIFRVVHLLYGIITNTQYFTLRMQRLSSMVGSEISLIFAIRCMLKKQPITFIISAFVGSIYIFSFCIRICEM